MISKRLKILLSVFLCVSASLSAGKDDIRLNQVGFYTFGPKIAVVVSPDAWYFSIKSVDMRETYYTGQLEPTKYWSSSGDSVKVADFSNFTVEGTYVLYVAGIGVSHTFQISGKIGYELTKGLIRHFYYQRASTNLPAIYAGQWARAGGHFDTKVVIHESAASPSRPAGSYFPSPKGWYDAGDYGKYIVNAGISTYQLLLLYEQFSEYFDTLNLNIPESNNNLPDLLDEIKWELDWVLTMQDPSDRGIYHKVTDKIFISDLMPASAAENRYFIGKSVTATYDFAAICAVAYRIYKKHLPSFADSLLQAAKYAYQWGLNNPKALYTANPPDVVTGAYNDGNAKDEHQWASYELYIATQEIVYKSKADSIKTGYGTPGWQNVQTLGIYSMALVQKDESAVNNVLKLADGVLNAIKTHPYRTTARNFYWGSNSVVANDGMALLVAYLLTMDCKYLEGAVHALDYLLGRNATAYSFVTGFGSKSPMNPHHRPSIADGIFNPVPGFLVGGPNAQAVMSECQSGGEYPQKEAKKWVDLSCSYSTNEIAINWNAPAAFLAGGIEAIFNLPRFSIQQLIEKYKPDPVKPVPSVLTISDIFPDNVTVCWNTSKMTTVTLLYRTDSLQGNYQKRYCSFSDSNKVILNGLMPDTKYFLKAVFIDRDGNRVSAETSFTTSASTVNAEQILNHNLSAYKVGTSLTVSFSNTSGFDVKLIYSRGGSSVKDTISFLEVNGVYSASVPGEKINESGIVYSFLLQNGDENFQSPAWSVAPDSMIMVNSNLVKPKRYSLISFPLQYNPVKSTDLLQNVFGDTSSWRYYGYNAESWTYTLFDTIKSGTGGWLYTKDTAVITVAINGEGMKPGSYAPVKLKLGWNLIGNPFPFPIYWNNCLIGTDSVLIAIADSISNQYIRQQIFLYEDTTGNNFNDGVYRTNRNLISHVYNDSILLEPWEAFWVYAEKDSVILLLNPEPTLKTVKGLFKKQVFDKDRWFYKISAKSGQISDQPVLLGVATGALPGYDQFDSPKPPSVSDELQIGFKHPEWNRYKGLYGSDIVANANSYEWKISVRHARNEPVTIEWEKYGDNAGALYLIDPKSGKSVDINTNSSYTFMPVKGEAERELIVSLKQSKTPYFSKLPEVWSLSMERVVHNRASVKFKLTVPVNSTEEAQRTMIEIFDVNGRSIKRIMDDYKVAGSYSVNWDRRNKNGKPVASGFYMVKLSSTSISKSIGMFLVD